MYRAHARRMPEPGAPSLSHLTGPTPVSPRWSPRVTLFDPETFTSSHPRRHAVPVGTTDVLRPIQYLGNKQRSLSTILGVIESMVPETGAVADFFSGTSVVAQGIASLGRRTVAVDVSPACAVIARATLGVIRNSSTTDAPRLAAHLRDEAATIEAQLRAAWEPFLAAEDHALAAGDGGRLLELGGRVPQVWRKLPSTEPLTDLLAAWEYAASSQTEYRSLLAPVFAGTYFSVRQAVELDARRSAVASLAKKQLIDPWEEAALITALLAAASVAAFTPGKHFAQPHRIDATKDLTFHVGRALSDRAVSVPTVVDEWVEALLGLGRSGLEGHTVLQKGVDDMTPDDLAANGISTVYADPPYTAQQYSRFYHVLDTLALGIPRQMQVVNGRVTAGLYPDGRYLSPYCSKRQARPAFTRLASLCRDAGSSLLLSYSTSSKESTGNARMISLPALLDVLASKYGRDAIEIIEFAHQYRQFNHRDVARTNRADPEVLVIAHAA